MATKVQTDIMRAFEVLGFAPQFSEQQKPGSPMKMAATNEALDALKGKIISVEASGSATVECCSC